MVSPTDIAIVGMSALFPGCRDLSSYWQNILNKVDNVQDAPDEWTGPYLKLNSTEGDRLYTRKGGFLRELAQFNPIEFGIMPNSVEAGDPDHFLSLKLARDALQDAGYSDRPFNRQKTGIILGRGTYTNRGGVGGVQHGVVIDQTIDLLSQLNPRLDSQTLSDIRQQLKASLPPFSADSIPGMVPNLLTGRIANRLDLMGPNYIIDAACASSLLAIEQAIEELRNGRCDMMLAGGVQAATPPQIFMMFCQLGALSHSKIRPFDESADGTLLAEGLGILVLKRLADAQQDGDRIYAAIKGLGSSSDGKALGLLAPRLEGQVLALQRVYKENGVAPDTVDLVEAHGTGMRLGDQTEIQSLTSVFGQRQGQIPRCALGSVKSAIGHCIPAAGVASVIKTALALYHKILPPTLCDRVNPALEIEQTPFYINTEARPWIHGNRVVPRRAGVNAFGFGGINAHALLEEYTDIQTKEPKLLHKQWSTELLIFSGDRLEAVIAQVKNVQQILQTNRNLSLANLAYTLSGLAFGTHRLAIVAKDISDLQTKLQLAVEISNPECTRLHIQSGIYYTDPNLAVEPGKTAFLFPGEGSQYPNMLADLCLHFPKVRAWFDTLDENFPDKSEYLPSSLIFPPPTSTTDEERDSIASQLFSMKVASGVLLVANLALYELLSDLGIECDIMLGHSAGEHAALNASGTIRPMEREQLVKKLQQFNQIYSDLEAKDNIPKGSAISVGAIEPALLKQLIDDFGDRLHLAMDNCPNQAVLFGSEADIDAVATKLKKAGGICVPLPFDRAYHTPLFAEVESAFCPYYADLDVGPGHTRLYSCVTCEAFPSETTAIRELAVKHLSNRVRFREAIEKLYEQEQVRTFITVGPSDDLTAFVDDILRDRNKLALASNSQRKSGVEQIQHMLARLFTNGRSVDMSFLYKYRELTKISLDPATSVTNVSQKANPVLDLTVPVMQLKPDFVASIQDKLHRQGADETKRTRGEGDKETREKLPTTNYQLPTTASLSGVTAHFELMQEFLASQARVMTTLMSQLTSGNATSDSSSSPVFPLLGQILERDAQHLYCERRFDLERDVFLHDHTIGAKLSERQPQLLPLPVIPFTVSMEIVAEAAACLVGGNKCVISLYNLRGYRWLALDRGEILLGIQA